MSDPYTGGKGRSRTPRDITNEYYLRVKIFIRAVDSQRVELNERFKEDVIELLIFSSALDPRDRYKSFRIDYICDLVNKYYPMYFSVQEKLHLKYQLHNYERDILVNPDFQNISTISELCQKLVKSGKSSIYSLIDRLIRLVLTLPISTATFERAFSAMKIVKTRLRNRMEDDFFSSYLITFIEKDIARGFDTDSIIDSFDLMGNRRVQL